MCRAYLSRTVARFGSHSLVLARRRAFVVVGTLMARFGSAGRGYNHTWRQARETYLKRNPLCTDCKKRGKITPATVVDHIVPHKGDQALFWDTRGNWQALCKPCHDRKTGIESSAQKHGASRPEWMPMPSCVVELVCGPPGSGKSTFVQEHAKPGDTIIDLDLIKAELSGLPLYHAGTEWLGPALYQRNSRLARLAYAPASHTAWVIVGGASKAVRGWWQGKLAPRMVHVFAVESAECKRRIRADHRRPKHVMDRQLTVVDEWWNTERGSVVPLVKKGCGIDGFPTDPMHPWYQSNR